MHRKQWIGLTGAAVALAAAPSAAHAAIRKTTMLEEWFISGGWITWFMLLPLSMVMVGLIIFYVMRIRRPLMLPELVRAQVRALLDQRQYREAIDFTAAEPSMFSRVMNSTLTEAAGGYAAMEIALDDAVNDQTTRYMRMLEWLNVVGNLGPMIGLFGTVVGMVMAFNKIVEVGGMPDPTQLAEGIGTALVTTVWGLVIAMPALTAYALFKSRIESVSDEIAATGREMISAFRPGRAAAPRKPAPAAQAQPAAQPQQAR